MNPASNTSPFFIASGAAHASRHMGHISIATSYSTSRHAHEHPCRRAQPQLSSPWRIRDKEGERPLNSCLPASFFLCLLTCMPPPTATLLCSELHFCLWAGSFCVFGRIRRSLSRPSSSSSTTASFRQVEGRHAACGSRRRRLRRRSCSRGSCSRGAVAAAAVAAAAATTPSAAAFGGSGGRARRCCRCCKRHGALDKIFMLYFRSCLSFL